MQYATNFDVAEDPLSEGGAWIGGFTTGLLWLDHYTSGGVCHGKRFGGTGSTIDPTAIHSGVWGSQQVITAVVDMVTSTGGQEIELRMNSVLAPNVNTGYEFLFDASGFMQLVRWNETHDSFTYLISNANIGRTFVSGDVVGAARQGSDLVGYFNGVEIGRVTDTYYMGGAPGFGLNNYAPLGTDPTLFGITSWSATDGQSNGGSALSGSGDLTRRQFGRLI